MSDANIRFIIFNIVMAIVMYLIIKGYMRKVIISYVFPAIKILGLIVLRVGEASSNARNIRLGSMQSKPSKWEEKRRSGISSSVEGVSGVKGGSLEVNQSEEFMYDMTALM